MYSDDLSKKELKLLRKRASLSDRSRFKKSDTDKLEKRLEEKDRIFVNQYSGNLNTGRVTSILSSGIIVYSEGKRYSCLLRGGLKKEINQIKNLAAVGDEVFFQTLNENEGVIYHIKNRFSILSRADNLRRNKEQLIAANVDQVFITTSVVSPPLKPALIDRYLISALKGNIKPIILINKIDLIEREADRKLFNELIAVYKDENFKIISLSVKNGIGIDLVCKEAKGKTSVFSGHSGVGKTTLINKITGSNKSVKEVVNKTNKGAHATTVAELMELPFGGWLIDTPGLKSFELWNYAFSDVEKSFPEIKKASVFCQFRNCKHINEPSCAVINLLEEKKISQLRYDSYLTIVTKISRRR